MKCLVILGLLTCTAGLTLAQDSQFRKTDYAAPFYVTHPVKFESDSSEATVRNFEPRTWISDPLLLVAQDGIIREITKAEFEELIKNTKGNIQFVKSLDNSKFSELYGSRGRDGITMIGLKNSQPNFSEEFLNENHAAHK